MQRHFDLFFCTPPERPLDIWTLHAACTALPHTIRQGRAADSGWCYENPSTGVRFYIRFFDPSRGASPIPAGHGDTGLCFHLPYGRPRFFAEESMPVVAGLCHALDLLVLDPQKASPLPAPADSAALIASWLVENRRYVRGERPDGALYVPRDVAMGWWAYQNARESLQSELGDEVYVPTVRILSDEEGSTVLRSVTWLDAMPFVFPPCDQVVLAEQSGSAHGFSHRAVDASVLRAELGPLLRTVPTPVGPLDMLEPARAADAKPIFEQLGEAYDPGRLDMVPSDRWIDEPPETGPRSAPPVPPPGC